MGAGILNGFSFGLGVNVNHQELARVDRKGVCVCVRVCACTWHEALLLSGSHLQG